MVNISDALVASIDGDTFRSSDWSCSIKKVLLTISQNSRENTCVEVPFVTELQAWSQLPKKVFSYEIWKKFSEHLFYITPPGGFFCTFQSENVMKTSSRRPYHFKVFKGYLPHTSLGPVLNTLFQITFESLVTIYWIKILPVNVMSATTGHLNVS